MPGLSDETRKKLIQHGKSVYLAYWSLDVLNNHQVTKDGTKQSIAQCVEACLLANPKTCDIQLGNKTLKLTVEGEHSPYTLNIQDLSRQNNSTAPIVIKALAKYTDGDIAHYLAKGSPYTIHKAIDKPLVISTKVGPDDNPIEVGGPDKISLYKLHISNLGRIIQHLESGRFNSNMLVSLTTGSGKTFTQALWMLVLQQAGVNGVFGVPEKLLGQYESDLKRLLPNDFFDDESPIIVNSVEKILMEPSAKQLDFAPENTLYSFDEAHLLAQRENLFVRAKSVAENYVNMYLTATPTPALNALASGERGKKRLVVVATMNNDQKVKNGYAEKTSSYSTTAQSIAEIGKNMPFKTRFGRWLADAVDKETGYNAANAFGEAYLYSISEKNTPIALKDELSTQANLRAAVRWSIQPSAFQGKTLICANHFEDIVSLDLLSQEMNSKEPGVIPSFSRDLYVNGNSFNRDNTYAFLQMREEDNGQPTHPDKKIYSSYASSRHEQYTHKLQQKIRTLAHDLGIAATQGNIEALTGEMMAGLANAPIENSKHGIIELTLSMLASQDQEGDLGFILQQFGSIYLDRQRKEDLTAFSETIQHNAKALAATPDLKDTLKNKLLFNEDTNPRGLNEIQAEELASIMCSIVLEFSELPIHKAQQITDNWFCDQGVINQLSPPLQERLTAFAQTHYKRYVFNRVEKNETIEKDRVFSHFVETKHGVGLINGEDVYKPKVRTKRAVEALNPKAQESVFTPVSNNNEDLANADNLFRLGITTLYCTDKKVEGFNDPNLQQVALVAHSDENYLANPANMIQAYGRNRGLNPLKTPNFFLVTQKGVKCVFGEKELNKPDYQGDYDQAIKRYKNNYLKKLAHELGDNIIEWIEANRDALHEVNDDALSDEVIKYLFNVLEEINQTNAYQYKLSQKDFRNVVKGAISHLKQKEEAMKTGTTFSFFVRVVAVLGHWFALLQQKIASRKPKRELKEKIAQLVDDTSEDERRAKLYNKMISIPIEAVCQHDLSRDIISMNIAIEASALKEIRDKYYSASLLKPLKFLDEENKANIESDHPQLKSIIEGVCSLVAISKVEDKEALALDAFKACTDKDTHKLFELFNSLAEKDINENHPQKAFHLERIESMLMACDCEEIPDNLEDIVPYIKRDDQVRQLIGTKLIENHQGIAKLRVTEESLLKQFDKVRNLIVRDITNLVSPLVNDAAYRDMLRFVRGKFSNNELLAIFGQQEIVDQLLEFIQETLAQGDDYYSKYFIPNYAKLKQVQAGNSFELSWIPFVVQNDQIGQLFKILHESHLRFYKITAQGEVNNPTPKDAQFFQSIDPLSPIMKQVAWGYDIRFVSSIDAVEKKPQTIYIQKLGNAIEKVVQVKADGSLLANTEGPFDNLTELLFDIKLENTSIKNALSNNQLIEFNRELLALVEASGQTFESIFSPSLSDETTPLGETWRRVLGLHTLKSVLPVVNRTNWHMKSKEYQKALEVSSSMLKGVLDGTTTRSSNSLKAKTSLFNQVLRVERKKNPNPSREMLARRESRVEKMRDAFVEKKEKYYGSRVKNDAADLIIQKIHGYINSRGVTTGNEVVPKPSCFFNHSLTADKLDLARKMIKKLQGCGTYLEILQEIEWGLKANNCLMRKHGKKPSDSNKLKSTLISIHETLLSIPEQELTFK